MAERKVTQEPEIRIWRCEGCGTIGPLTDEEQTDVSCWYERQIRRALSESGLTVRHYPRRGKNDPNPDWLIVRPDGPDWHSECTVVFQDRDCAVQTLKPGVHICGGDIRESDRSIYDSLRKKISKYRSLVDGRAYVVAVRDETCGNRSSRAIELAFSAYMRTLTLGGGDNVVEVGWKDAWSDEQAAGLLHRFPHCSGLLYSDTFAKHYFVRNPGAEVPVADDLFPFASIPKRVTIGDGTEPMERGPLIAVNGEPYPHIREFLLD